MPQWSKRCGRFPRTSSSTPGIWWTTAQVRKIGSHFSRSKLRCYATARCSCRSAITNSETTWPAQTSLGFRDQSGINRPYGTTRLGNTRFLFLNGMHDWSAGDEREWLERTLERSDAEADLVWRIAVVHHGPWSLGPHGANARLIAAGVPALLAAHKVDLLLSGHDHIYQRGNAGPLKYIVSGGGGAPLYGIEGTDPTERKAESTYHFVAVAVTEERIRTLAMRVDGTIIESCGFESRGAWECSPDVSMVAHSAAGPARSAPARSTSHCGCAVLGGWRIDAVVALGASALVGVTARHRRRMVRR